MYKIKAWHLLGCAAVTFILTAQTLNSEREAQMESLTPNFMVHDVNKTIAYYEKHFGFKVVNKVPEEGQFDWAMVSAGSVSLMFQKKETIGKRSAGPERPRTRRQLKFLCDREGRRQTPQ